MRRSSATGVLQERQQIFQKSGNSSQYAPVMLQEHSFEEFYSNIKNERETTTSNRRRISPIKSSTVYFENVIKPQDPYYQRANWRKSKMKQLDVSSQQSLLDN